MKNNDIVKNYIEKRSKTDLKFKRKYDRLFANIYHSTSNFQQATQIADAWVLSHFTGFNIIDNLNNYHLMTINNNGRLYNINPSPKVVISRMLKGFNNKHSSVDVSEIMSTNYKKLKRMLELKYSVGEHDIGAYFKNKSFGKLVGVEIECIVPLTDIGGDTRELGFMRVVEFFKKFTKEAKIPYLTVSQDGSINGIGVSEVGVEFKFVVDLDKGFGDLEKLCNKLRDLKVKVNSSCGMHIHLDHRHFINDKDMLLRNINRLSNSLFGLKFLVPRSRRNNSYCKMQVNYTTDLYYYTRDFNKKVPNRGVTDRYSAINSHSLESKQTIEVRLHSGTISFQKIKNWIEICHNVVNNPKFDSETIIEGKLQELSSGKNVIGHFIKLLDLPKEKQYLSDYILERYERFEHIDNEGVIDERSIEIESLGELNVDSVTAMAGYGISRDTRLSLDALQQYIISSDDYQQRLNSFYRNGYFGNRSTNEVIIDDDGYDDDDELQIEPMTPVQIPQPTLREQRRMVYDLESRDGGLSPNVNRWRRR